MSAKFYRLIVLMLCLGTYAVDGIGQPAMCNLSCQDQVYVALDENCQYQVTEDDVLKNWSVSCPTPIIEVYDKYNRVISGSLLDQSHRGEKLVYKVTNPADANNSCWGYITPEDKWAPVVMCEDDTLNCWDAEEFINASPDTDNCGYVLNFQELRRIWVDFNCEDDSFIGYVERDVISTDIWGNTARCDSQRIYIIREYLDSLVCPDSLITIECCTQKFDPDLNQMVDVLWSPKYVYEDEYGYSHPIPKVGGLAEPPYLNNFDGRRHYIGNYINAEGGLNNGKCNIVTTYKDHIIPTCGATYKIRREWKLVDWCEGRDTTCVQWIKIVDTLGPMLKDRDGLTPLEQDICIESFTGDYFNFDKYNLENCSDTVSAFDITSSDPSKFVYYANPHDCKAHVELTRPTIMQECGFKFAKGDEDKLIEEQKKIQVHYQIKYLDKGDESTIRVISGELDYDEKEIIYLPAGWFTVVYFIKDECWNETIACEQILVVDNTPPTPVCDEITQVTLDPESCWTRIHAIDLDDGSNDNCSHKLHFAIANMDTIEFYRNYWVERIIEEKGEYEYNHYIDTWTYLIEKWIECFIFESYIDVSECGEEMLVLRVYEAHGLPVYDPHVFVGTEHDWFCFNNYDDYACFFKWNYDKFAKHENPRIDICSYSLSESDIDSEVLVGFADLWDECIESYRGIRNPMIVDQSNGCTCTLTDGNVARGPQTSEAKFLEELFDLYHGPLLNDVYCEYERVTSSRYPAWLEKQEIYPELQFLDCKRFAFQHLYNDCMIQVIKDDKTPPICIPPADATYYCDGVPESGSFFPLNGNDEIVWTSARFAHDICDGSDVYDPNCEFDRTDDADSKYFAPGSWCFATWTSSTSDGFLHGYYGGPNNEDYSYEDPCNEELLDWYPDSDLWKPIYCRFWLMLDIIYDPIDGEGKPDPYRYFGDVEVQENCWDYEEEIITEGELDNCGTGVLTRTWIITDKCGNTSSCTQRITIKPRSDFEVKFPADIEVNCDEVEDLSPIPGDPELYPVVADDDCEQIGITYSDQVIDVLRDGCYKILRTWKVIDWCVYVPDIHNRYPDVIVDDRCVADPEDRACVYRHLKDDGDGFITYSQVIRVVDDVAPVVTCIADTTICIYDEVCDATDVELFLGDAEDNCTENLQYRYAVNPNGDSPESAWVYGHGNILDETLPVGVHIVILYAKDDCGNEGHCEFELEIKDCKLPTPYCFDGIATVIMPSSGEVAVWASDLDAGSFDNCTPKDSLIFSFEQGGDVPSRVFTCDDIPDKVSERIEVEIWVMDQAGNEDFCMTTILLQDGVGDACKDISAQANTTDMSAKGMGKTNNQKSGGSGDIIFTLSKVGNQVSSGKPELYQNRPNPYNQETIVNFAIPNTMDVTLRILDINGREISRQEASYGAGVYEWNINKADHLMSSGVYYYQLITKGYAATKKMVVVD